MDHKTESSWQTSVNESNLQAFQLLFNIEVGLREFIIASCSAHFGLRWWSRHYVPVDVLTKSQERLESERKAGWTRLTLFHPIYYSDFPDLRKILISGNLWRPLFEGILKRKELVNTSLEELEPIRNKIGHNRKVHSSDFQILHGSYRALSNLIGPSQFDAYVKCSTEADGIHDKLRHLRSTMDSATQKCMDTSIISFSSDFDAIIHSWWFTDDYLGTNLEEVRNLYEVFRQYEKLPRTRGSGHRIEEWVQTQNVDARHNNAITILENLLKSFKE